MTKPLRKDFPRTTITSFTSLRVPELIYGKIAIFLRLISRYPLQRPCCRKTCFNFERLTGKNLEKIRPWSQFILLQNCAKKVVRNFVITVVYANTVTYIYLLHLPHPLPSLPPPPPPPPSPSPLPLPLLPPPPPPPPPSLPPRFFAKELYYRITTQSSEPNINYLQQWISLHCTTILISAHRLHSDPQVPTVMTMLCVRCLINLHIIIVCNYKLSLLRIVFIIIIII